MRLRPHSSRTGLLSTPTPLYRDESGTLRYRESLHDYYYQGARHYLDDTELNAMIEKARNLSDWDERAPIYADIQQRIVDLQPEIFGMMRQRMFAYRDYVQGYSDSPIRMTSEVDLYPLYIQPK